jgi:hypothetical protein
VASQGYIEYPSHYNNGLDSPVGLAFRTEPIGGLPSAEQLPAGCAWFSRLPAGLYEEQREFLPERLGFPLDPCLKAGASGSPQLMPSGVSAFR